MTRISTATPAGIAAIKFQILELNTLQRKLTRGEVVQRMSDIVGETKQTCNRALVASDWNCERALELCILGHNAIERAITTRDERLAREKEEDRIRDMELDVQILASSCNMELSEDNIKFIAGIVRLARAR